MSYYIKLERTEKDNYFTASCSSKIYSEQDIKDLVEKEGYKEENQIIIDAVSWKRTIYSKDGIYFWFLPVSVPVLDKTTVEIGHVNNLYL